MLDGVCATPHAALNNAGVEVFGPCARCGEEHLKTSKFKLYCDECIRAGNRRRNKAWEDKRRIPLVCMFCGEITERTSSRQKTCIECRPKLRLMRTLEWQASNPEKMKKIRRKSYSKRRARPEVCINDAMSRAIGRSISTKMDSSWHELVGYSASELTDHLERQFLQGMSLHNYGEWEIDHIIPLREFAFNEPTDPEFLFCWGLPNLRPVWKSNNRSKSGKRLYLI